MCVSAREFLNRPACLVPAEVACDPPPTRLPLPPARLQVLPRLGQLLHQWSPLDQPGLAAAEFAAWRPLLESEASRQGAVFGGSSAADLHSGADSYMRLVAELVLPPLRKDLTNSWDPRWVAFRGPGAECFVFTLVSSAAVLFATMEGPVLSATHLPVSLCPPTAPLRRPLACRDAARLERFVEAWEPLLPAAALQYIMESLVLPRLRLAVQAWDPLRDTVALHTWVHPWLVSGQECRLRQAESSLVGLLCSRARACTQGCHSISHYPGAVNNLPLPPFPAPGTRPSLPPAAAFPGPPDVGAVARHPLQVCQRPAGLAPL